MADLIALKERYAGRNDSLSQSDGIDVEAYLSHYGYVVKNIKTNGTSTIYTLDHCPFDPNHAGGEASIIKTSEGKLLFQCFHDSCKGRTWKEARQIISGSDSLRHSWESTRTWQHKRTGHYQGFRFLSCHELCSSKADKVAYQGHLGCRLH